MKLKRFSIFKCGSYEIIIESWQTNFKYNLVIYVHYKVSKKKISLFKKIDLSITIVFVINIT